MQDSLRVFKAGFFKALAHPARIKILEQLRPGELSVTELQGPFKDRLLQRIPTFISIAQ